MFAEDNLTETNGDLQCYIDPLLSLQPLSLPVAMLRVARAMSCDALHGGRSRSPYWVDGRQCVKCAGVSIAYVYAAIAIGDDQSTRMAILRRRQPFLKQKQAPEFVGGAFSPVDEGGASRGR